MSERVTQRRRVEDEGPMGRKLLLRGKNSPIYWDLTVPLEKAPANYVPAAAVIRRVRALSGITGCKRERRRVGKSLVKSGGSTSGLPMILLILSTEEEDGIPGVAVKCVDIRKNTGGEGGLLVCN